MAEKFYLLEKDAVLKKVSSAENGLSSAEAKTRAERNGKNMLKAPEGKSLIRKFLEQLCDPMIIILLCAAAVSGVLAVVENESFSDVIIILAVVIINAVLGVYQENKAEKAIDALAKMSAAKTKVIRDGIMTLINSEDLVVGDVIVLEAGDAIPADCRLLSSFSMKSEEAALTGESVPVNKHCDIIEADANGNVPLGDRKNMVYMGSTCVYGRGTAVVTAIGMDTEMGKIADALNNAVDGETPLQIKMGQLSKILTYLVLGICIIVFGVSVIKAGTLDFNIVLDSFMIAVSLAVAAIPEGLAAVVTIVLSIGVTNMSKRNAIIRHMTAVETLGCAQIICSDKTGTLTQNKMTVTDYYSSDKELLAKGMTLCNDANPDENGNAVGEPTECALVNFATKNGIIKPELIKLQPRVGEVPFDSSRKLMSTVHKNGSSYIQYTKGAPDELLSRCTHILTSDGVKKLDDSAKNEILAQNKRMADSALRVLACAYKELNELPDEYTTEKVENGLIFLGLCGMIDPVRPEVKDAIVECRSAGIRPIMITGDHINTAVAIAKELGIYADGMQAITGSQLGEMSDAEYEKVYDKIAVYARVQPEHKTRIVNMWRSKGYVTAMTGDGVNDAPSIKSADIGVGMGITGTDVTKNVADMVLSDDNFATIVGAVEEGRRIYDNIRKAIQFLLGSNMSEVLSIFFATLMGFTILKPVHLLWINLVTDCFPALALGMEKAEGDIMKRKPRDAKAGIFAQGMGIDIAYQGVAVTILVLISYFIGSFLETGRFTIGDSDAGTTMAFITMSMTEIFHSFNMRSQKNSIFTMGSHNIVLILAAIGSLIATTAVCEIPVIANMFGFTAVDLKEYAIALCLSVCIIPIVEIVKAIKRAIQK